MFFKKKKSIMLKNPYTDEELNELFTVPTNDKDCRIILDFYNTDFNIFKDFKERDKISSQLIYYYDFTIKKTSSDSALLTVLISAEGSKKFVAETLFSLKIADTEEYNLNVTNVLRYQKVRNIVIDMIEFTKLIINRSFSMNMFDEKNEKGKVSYYYNQMMKVSFELNKKASSKSLEKQNEEEIIANSSTNGVIKTYRTYIYPETSENDASVIMIKALGYYKTDSEILKISANPFIGNKLNEATAGIKERLIEIIRKNDF